MTPESKPRKKGIKSFKHVDIFIAYARGFYRNRLITDSHSLQLARSIESFFYFYFSFCLRNAQVPLSTQFCIHVFYLLLDVTGEVHVLALYPTPGMQGALLKGQD